MPQHLWHVVRTEHWRIRVCEVCEARQITGGDPAPVWPQVSLICPGDPEDGGRRARRRPPIAPAGAPKQPEEALA